MAQAKLLTLSPSTVLGLFFLQRYRFLTITQFAKAAAGNSCAAKATSPMSSWAPSSRRISKRRRPLL